MASAASEEIVGKALAQDGRRNRAVIATTSGSTGRMSDRSATAVRSASSRKSLPSLRPSAHRCDRRLPGALGPIRPCRSRTPPRPCPGLLSRRQDQRHRVSNFSPAEMEIFPLRRAAAHTAQPPYNMFERAIEADVLPYCRDKGIGSSPTASLCRGLLSGRMSLEDQVRRRRSAPPRSENQAPRLPSMCRRSRSSIGWRASGSAGASSIWRCAGVSTNRHRRGAVGRAASRSARARARGPGLAHRRGKPCANRPDPPPRSPTRSAPSSWRRPSP